MGQEMRNQYYLDIEKQLNRLWVGANHVVVIKLGSDKFMLSDGYKTLTAHGSKIIRIVKPLRDRCGVDKFWSALEPLGVKSLKKNITITTR